MAVPVPALSDFVAAHPEFKKCPEALANYALARAAARTRAATFSDDSEQMAVFLRAAILLCKLPEARKLKLVSDDMAFVWSDELFELQRSATMGMRAF